MGNNAQINGLLLSVLSSSGIKSYPVLLRRRSQGRLPLALPSLDKISTFIVAAETNDGKTYYNLKFESKRIIKYIPGSSTICRLSLQKAFSPSFREKHPLLYVAPKNFIIDGVSGSFATIKEMGDFQNKLNRDRNTLSPEMKQKILSLTKNANSDKEKIKILYDYLGQTTRYESIQLGIGGLQPIESGEVSKTGFGDCKGLSFYLKSMLEAINIPSHYTIIELNETEKNLQKDFTSYLQSNHVILSVSLQSETLWLECTNPNVPFGYVHSSIAGHNAILVTPEGADFVRLPDYKDIDNLSQNNITVNFNGNDETLITVNSSNFLKFHEELSPLLKKSKNEQIDYVRSNISLQNATINDLSIEERKSAHPEFILKYALSSKYGNKTGNRYFIPLNAFRTLKTSMMNTERNQDIVISNGWKNMDNIEIKIPDGFEIEYLSESLTLESPFGLLESSIKSNDENSILITQSFVLNSGRWSVKQYNDFIDFLKNVSHAYNDEIVLKNTR